MKIYSCSVPHVKQRYDTCGDYFFDPYDPAELNIRISACKDWRSEAGVLVHELVEYFLTKRARVSIEKIDAWDLDHADADEPGDVPDCPYAKQHRFAENIERLLVAELGLTWRQHEENIADACSEFRPERSPGAGGGIRREGAGIPARRDRGLPAEASRDGACGGHQFPEIGGPHANDDGDHTAGADPAA